MSKGKPVSGTNEWSTSTVNIQSGCRNNCIYCYARQNAIRFGRKTPGDSGAAPWRVEVLDKDKAGKNYGKRRGQVMFPSSHDITEGNWEACASVICNLAAAGNKVLVVSKPRFSLIRRVCHFLTSSTRLYPPDPRDVILWRFTIGAARNDILAFWEPNAPTYEDRIHSLMWAHYDGWQTSVSMEPLLEWEWYAVQRQVEAMAPYVTDAIWIGKANHLRARCRVNLGGLPNNMAVEIAALERSQSDARIQELYLDLKDNPMVRWKESIKAVVGLEVATEKGTDR